MRIRPIVAPVMLALLPAAVAAEEAPSPDAVALMEAEVSQACGGSGGHQITANGFLEHDLTGDGIRDLLIQHSEITCAGGPRSGFCGAQVCTYKVWVRRGGTLVLALDSLGIVDAIDPSPLPVMTVYPHGGPQFQLQWNGSAFAVPR